MGDAGAELGAVPEVLKLTDLVSYQDGSVVSRTIVKKENGSVTVFAFDGAQVLSEHTAPFSALVQVIEGRTEVSIEGKPYPLGPGDVILMPADIPHSVRAIERFKMVLTMIRS